MKRKEVEFTKLQTLSLYLDQERKNLEKLRNTSGQDANILKAETTIRTLENQLKQTRGEVSLLYSIIFHESFCNCDPLYYYTFK